MLPLLLAGLALGVGGGLSPGPLTALVLTQTLRHGTREGLKVALAPVLTDGPLLVLSALTATALGDTGLGVLSLLGAVVLGWLAAETAQVSGVPQPDAEAEVPVGLASVRRAVLTNIFNPHPYVFWFTVGGPLVATAPDASAVAAFCVAFFGGLCGSKIVLAVAVGSARHRLSDRVWRWGMRALAVAMAALALRFAVDGIGRLTGS